MKKILLIEVMGREISEPKFFDSIEEAESAAKSLFDEFVGTRGLEEENFDFFVGEDGTVSAWANGDENYDLKTFIV